MVNLADVPPAQFIAIIGRNCDNHHLPYRLPARFCASGRDPRGRLRATQSAHPHLAASETLLSSIICALTASEMKISGFCVASAPRDATQSDICGRPNADARWSRSPDMASPRNSTCDAGLTSRSQGLEAAAIRRISTPQGDRRPGWNEKTGPCPLLPSLLLRAHCPAVVAKTMSATRRLAGGSEAECCL
jgi:hypothetical protein